MLPIADAQGDAARQLAERLRGAGIRVTVDDSSQTLNYRIREGEMAKVPYMAVVGQREAEGGTVAVRTRGKGSKQEILPVEEFASRVAGESVRRSLTP